jgi:predicted DNA-binding protein
MAKNTRPMPFSLRLWPELRKRLEVLAEADRRTLTNYILTILERHVEKSGEVLETGHARKEKE